MKLKILKEYKKYEWEIFHLNINYRTDARLLDLYDSIFQKMGEDGYLPYNKDNDRLSSGKIFESDDNELLQCVPCHGKDQDVHAFYHARYRRGDPPLGQDLPAYRKAGRDHGGDRYPGAEAQEKRF